MADMHASFTGSIPEYYDSCLGPAWFDAFGEDLVRRLPAKPAGDVLEIACGTGLVTRRLRERLDPAVRPPPRCARRRTRSWWRRRQSPRLNQHIDGGARLTPDATEIHHPTT